MVYTAITLANDRLDSPNQKDFRRDFDDDGDELGQKRKTAGGGRDEATSGRGGRFWPSPLTKEKRREENSTDARVGAVFQHI